LVVDPVMIATSGASLLAADALATLKSRLIPRAAVVTPNVPEAEKLLDRRIGDVAAMRDAGRDMLQLGCAAVLLKGGHLDGSVVHDVLASAGGLEVFESPRIATTSTHGTGCTLASAIATGLAQGMDLKDAVVRARAYVRKAIATAPGLGRGRGPLNHAVRL
ncbi:MAG: hydroxymethylpyrimidine/phosphomethylpyrimidine kinase, partial [Proteobacteria bacterium]|nr:hydroxymethylpyrimidine/phosphomethylpyrimidine kinase [Pseudomonadota bacterium]